MPPPPFARPQEDRLNLVEAARTCDRIFIGTDSAPHAIGMKESGGGAGRKRRPPSFEDGAPSAPLEGPSEGVGRAYAPQSAA